MDAVIAEKCPDASEHHKKKVKQLWKKSKLRHACITVCTEQNTIVEDTARCMGGSTTAINCHVTCEQANSDHSIAEKIINVEVVNALKKAHEEEHHWIIADLQNDSWPAPVMEHFNSLMDDNKLIKYG